MLEVGIEAGEEVEVGGSKERELVARGGFGGFVDEADVVVEWSDVERCVVVRNGRRGLCQFLPLTRIWTAVLVLKGNSSRREGNCGNRLPISLFTRV